MIRWPGKIKAGVVSNGIFSGLDWFPTLLAAAGDTTIKERLPKGTDERADIVSDQCDDWRVQNAYLMGWLVWKAAPFLESRTRPSPSGLAATARRRRRGSPGSPSRGSRQ